MVALELKYRYLLIRFVKNVIKQSKAKSSKSKRNMFPSELPDFQEIRNVVVLFRVL